MKHFELIELDELAAMLREREGPPHPLRRRRRPWQNRMSIATSLAAALAVAVVVFLVVRSGDDRPSKVFSSSSASCAVTVEWRGITYRGTSVQQPMKLGAPLGHGSVPACNDTPGNSDGTGPQPLALAEIAGIPPAQAVASADWQTLYLAPGYFPQVPGTLLHDLIYGMAAGVPDERRDDCRDAKTRDVRAKVLAAINGFLNVDLDDAPGLPRRTVIFPDARTLFTGGGSPPHVDPGNTVRARVLVCRHPDDPHFLKLVATRLAIGERSVGG
jgi:hypothetical protein